MSEFTITFENTQCPYFYDEGYHCSHLSVQGMCKKEVCPMIEDEDSCDKTTEEVTNENQNRNNG